MKKLNSWIFAGISASVVLLACASTNAQTSPPVSIWVDENGNATTDGSTPISSTIMNQGAVSFDETTSTGPVLKYATGTSYDLIGGVVFIYDDAAHTQLSDVISFFEDGVGYLQFYSLDNGGDKADVSAVPSYCYSLLNEGYGISLTEGANGVTTYTPGSPSAIGAYLINGSEDPAGFNVTYNFVSDDPASAAPDSGTTVGLLAIGLAGLAALKRKIARS